jgi:hypothetical protein
MNVLNVINGNVFCSKESTSGFAGLFPNSFKIPNQKYTTKIAMRATGIPIACVK